VTGTRRFPASPQRPQSRPQEGEAQDDDGVGAAEPDRQCLITRPEFAVDDSGVARGQFLLPRCPLDRIGWGQPAVPKQRIQLDQRQPGPLAELSSEGGFPSTAATEDHHSPHAQIMLDVRATPAVGLEMRNARLGPACHASNRWQPPADQGLRRHAGAAADTR
jgi:hypothetical protein